MLLKMSKFIKYLEEAKASKHELQGAKAFKSGGDLKDCPYKKGTYEETMWKHGFNRAKQGTL